MSASKYLISSSDIPSAWRTGDYLEYAVEAIVDNDGPFPIQTDSVLIGKWKREGAAQFSTTQKVVSDEAHQKTIPSLKYNETDFLALWGTTPGLYHASADYPIPIDRAFNAGDWVGEMKPYIGGNTKYVNCIRGRTTGYPSASSVTPYWGYFPWLVCQMSYYRQRGEKENPLYSESSGNGLLFTFVNEEYNSTNHSFKIWRSGQQTISVTEDRPIKSEGQYYDSATTYTMRSMFYDRGGIRPTQGAPFVVNILIAAAGAGGCGSGIGWNGNSGGSGAVGLFQVDLSVTSDVSPIRITLGGPGSSGHNGAHSYIQFYRSGQGSAYSEGWRIGGGYCSDDSDRNNLCSVLTQPWENTDTVIKKIWSHDGTSWNNGISATTFEYGNQVFYFQGGNAGGDGGGAGSLFCDGGARHTGWINNGDSAFGCGAGGGGGCGSGSGGGGGYSWMAIFY